MLDAQVLGSRDNIPKHTRLGVSAFSPKKGFFFISFPLMNLKLGPNNKQQSTTNFHFLKK